MGKMRDLALLAALGMACMIPLVLAEKESSSDRHKEGRFRGRRGVVAQGAYSWGAGAGSNRAGNVSSHDADDACPLANEVPSH